MTAGEPQIISRPETVPVKKLHIKIFGEIGDMALQLPGDMVQSAG